MNRDEVFDAFICVCRRPRMYVIDITALEATLRTIVWIGLNVGTLHSYDEYVRKLGFPNDLAENDMGEFGQKVLNEWFWPMAERVTGPDARKRYGPKMFEHSLEKDEKGNVYY